MAKHFSVISVVPLHEFTIPVRADTGEDDECLSCTLKFTYTPKYPEEPPEIEVQDENNFDEGPRLTEHLEEVVSSSSFRKTYKLKKNIFSVKI